MFNRLLARLLVSAPNRWIFKGAVVLDYRIGERARFTMDLDLAHQQDAEAATNELLAAQAVELPSTPVKGPALLGFAGIPAIKVPAIPVEDHVAEKLHAYTREFGDRRNTRVKDLIDLVLISSEIEFEAWKLRKAIDCTFDLRGVQPVPERLPLPPENWITPYRKLADESGLSPDVANGHAVAAAFLAPVLTNTVSPSARWDPTTRAWKKPDDDESSG